MEKQNSMAVNGYPIKAQVSGTFEQNEPWFHSVKGTFSGWVTDGGFAKFTLNDASGLEVDQEIWIQTTSKATYPDDLTTITAIDGNDVTTALVFAGTTETGFWTQPENITWDEDTPEDFLRQIHVQFDTVTDLIIGVTLDGINYVSINNDETIKGLATFTLFVQKGSLLNFQYFTATADQDINCVVTTM